MGLIFLVPGVNETFRVNGQAVISTDPALLREFEVDSRIPKVVLLVTVEEVFVQCSRALLRSDLWNSEKYVARECLPSLGTILAKHTGGKVDAESYDAEAKASVHETLY